MGASSSPDIGTKYYVAWHVMLGKRMDAVLELRAGDKTAWSGWVADSTTVSITRPQLFGGDTDQGGMVGTLAIMMGEADQQPNAYLISIFGPRVVAWRGFTGLAWQGGEYGSNNPYPFKMSAKTFSCYQIWDEPDGWYPETAAVAIDGSGTAALPVWMITFAADGGGTVKLASNPLDWSAAPEMPQIGGLNRWSPGGPASLTFNGTDVLMVTGTPNGSVEKALVRDVNGAYSTVSGLTLNTSEYRSLWSGGGWFVAAGDIYFSATGASFAAASTAPAKVMASDGTKVLTCSGGYQSQLGMRTFDPDGSNETVVGFPASSKNFSTAGVALGCDGGVFGFLGHQGSGSCELWGSGDRGDNWEQYATTLTAAATSPPLLKYFLGRWWAVSGTDVRYGPTLANLSSSHTLAANARGIDSDGIRVLICGDSGMLETWTADGGWDSVDSGVATTIYDVVSLGEYVAPSATAYAMNPVHIIVHAHTHSEMAGNPLETINDASARAAADWFYAQGFGINVRQRVAQESPSDVIKRVERVAGLSFTRNMATGLWEFYVANGEYDLDSLPILTDDDIISFKETPTVLDNAVNSVQVKYFDPERKETVITPPLRALGLVDLYGEIQQVFDFPEIPTGSIAGRVGWREALNYGTPSRRFDLVAKPTGAAYDLNRGQYFRLQLPKRGIADMVCNVGDKKEGTLRSGAIELAVVQDVFSFPDTVYSDVEHGIDARPSQVPVAIAAQVAFEAPYVDLCTRLPRAELEALPADVGFLAAAAADPARSRDFALLVAPSGGEYVEGGLGDFCPSATVVEVGRRDGTQRDFTLATAQGLASVEVGDPVIWGSEWCRVDALDTTALTITLGRACADTTPQEHAAGERLYFYRDGAAYDPTERVDGEADDVKLLTNTGSDRLDAAYATPLAITFASRQSRPYPPAHLRINTLPAPAYLYGALTVEWVHRDRLLQADQLVDTEEAGIGPEAGTTYTVRTYVDGVLDDTQTGITGTSATVNPSASGNLRIEVEAERDGAASWQAQVREFAYTTTEAEPWELQGGDVLQTQTGDTIYLMG